MLTVLDTSVLINPHGLELDGPVAISIISVAELEFGVVQAPDEKRRVLRLARFTDVVRTFTPLPVDHAVAHSYAEVAAHTVRQGRQPRARSLDLLIAATAHAHGARLVTRNGADFAHLGAMIELIAI